MENFREYAKHVGGDEFLLKWCDTTLKKHLEKNDPTTEEVEHILDYLVQSGKKLERMSYSQAKKLAEAWNKTQQKKGNAIEEKPEDTETVLDFGDGFRIAKLVGENAYKREGFLMRHCVASYYGRDVEIYSLRDKNNMPHATMERDQQIKGKGNGDIHPKYVGYVVKFLEHVGMTVGDSEMAHLGYMNVEKIKKHLHKDTEYFNKKYLPQDAKLIGKDGEEFASLDLLDVKPLIKDTGTELKINFDLQSFIKLSIDFLFKTKKTFFSGYSAQLASSGDYAQVASSGDYARLASSGNSAQVASSGNSAQVASSGYSAQLASSGYSAQLASSGYSAQLASSGDSAKLASSGDSAQLASSGDSAKLASSGYSAKLASSGDSAKLASSGDSAKLASSGYSAQLAIDGNDSVGANIGINGIIKGKKGNWITLADYKNGKPICVKSAQIDGKTIKEDTWYKLEDGRFMEVKID